MERENNHSAVVVPHFNMATFAVNFPKTEAL